MRKKSVVMTPVEIRFMEALWKKKQASVGEITKELASKAPTAYSTALTMLRIMEQKGYVNHTKQGRAFIYYPLIDRQGARSSAIRNMLSSLFD
ncbi:MAG: BlaI/MecI/CopY family transcriptional regulator, partial [Pyrinomonadaceae bacterium]